MSDIIIPDKYDIIPIHSSDRAAFKACRRRWDWSSPSRSNLSVRADIFGVNQALFFGTGIHYALEQFYTPTLRRDPIEAFTEWFDIQWRGGVVTHEWLDRVYDLKPRTHETSAPLSYNDPLTGVLVTPKPITLWTVRGLSDIIPDPDPAEFAALRELGINMMQFYKEYAAEHDGFEVYIAEHLFSIPIWDYEKNCIMKAVDWREQSPNFGKELEVHARGRLDGQWISPSGKFGIIDHKTATKWGEDELLKLESDEQCTNYLYAAEVEAKYYDLPHAGEPVQEIIYNVLRKAFPKEPTELSSGMFSINRQEESTTASILENWIARNLPGVPLNEKQEAYLSYLREIGDEQFIIRKSVRRNKHQIANAGERLYLEACDMLDPNLRIYPNIRNDWSCLNCSFRAPCLAKEDGSDWEQMINDNYTVAKDR